MKRNRHIGLERRDGFDVGRDPRDMSAGDLEQLGHEERAALRARLAPEDASAPTVAQKTGSEIDTSASDGVRVPNVMADDFSPTEMNDGEGDAQ